MNKALHEVVSDLIEALDEAYDGPAPNTLLTRTGALARSMYATTNRTGSIPSAQLTLAYLAIIEAVCILKTSPDQARQAGIFGRLAGAVGHTSSTKNEPLFALACWYSGIGLVLQQFLPGEHPAYTLGGVRKVIRAFSSILAAVEKTGDYTRKAVALGIMAEMHVWALEPERALQCAKFSWTATFEAQSGQQPPLGHTWLEWCANRVGSIVAWQGRPLPQVFDARELLYRPGELLATLPPQ